MYYATTAIEVESCFEGLTTPTPRRLHACTSAHEDSHSTWESR
jgi:hypothetical protein